MNTLNCDEDVKQVSAALADAAHAGGLSVGYYRAADDALARIHASVERLTDSIPRSLRRVLLQIVKERENQDAKWGEQNHDDMVWSAVLGEEFGEACRAALESRHQALERDHKAKAHLREELVQVAAVAAAWIECIDRCESPSA